MSHRFVRTFKARKIFLDNLAAGNSVSFSAHAAGGKTANFKRWREQDENFAADWDEAIEEGTDFIEDVATQRAMLKSDPLMAMILKARRPEKYDRGSKLELSGGISVEGSKQKLLNRIARLQASGQALAPESVEEKQALPEEPETKLLPPPDPSRGVSRGSKRRAAERGDRREASS